MNRNLIIEKLKNNEVVAYPTDTVFGLVVKLDKKNISKLNNLKKRDSGQPLQILFGSIEQASRSLKKDYYLYDYLANNYKDKTSYLVETNNTFNNKYLSKEFNRTILFRIPKGDIINVIKEVGPLFATSANLHGQSPMTDKKLIEDTFSIAVSDIEQQTNESSHIISVINHEIKELR